MKDTRVDFEIDGKRIPAAFMTGDAAASGWCVVLIAGSGPADLDGNYAEGGMWPGKTDVLLQLSQQFAARGVACFRYSRANLETLDEAKAQAFKRFDHRAVVAQAACRIARELSGARIAAAGHSEGSVVGSMLCARPNSGVDALISLSGPAYRFYDLMLVGADRRAVNGLLHFGPTPIPVDLYKKSVEVARYGRPAPEELKALPFGFHTMDAVSQEYLRGYDAVDNNEVMARANMPVLVVQGGADGSVWAENGERLVEARRKHSSALTDYAFFPELDHFYKKPGQYAVDESVANYIADWLKLCRS
jgi:pimeloyl-ACP methyl ester carboxylesterase